MQHSGEAGKPYARFHGVSILDTATCRYAQGEPPQSERQSISADDGELVFAIESVDAKGESHSAVFRGKPDGVPVIFEGGPLAEFHLSGCAISGRIDHLGISERIVIDAGRAQPVGRWFDHAFASAGIPP